MAQQPFRPTPTTPPPAEDPNKGFQLAVLSMAAAALSTVLDQVDTNTDAIYTFDFDELASLRRAKATMQLQRSRLNGNRL